MCKTELSAVYQEEREKEKERKKKIEIRVEVSNDRVTHGGVHENRFSRLRVLSIKWLERGGFKVDGYCARFIFDAFLSRVREPTCKSSWSLFFSPYNENRLRPDHLLYSMLP